MYYWHGAYGLPVIFGLTHIRELCSVMYLNIAGFVILLLGSLALFKKDRRLFSMVFFCILVYEVYFGAYRNICSPLRYLHPLLPVAALIFASGIHFITVQNKRLIGILVACLLVLAYNYFDIWRGISFGPTSVQKARAYIEKNIPEFTRICITSNQHMPQLNMTKESYEHLIQTAPIIEKIEGHEINYKKLSDDSKYGTAKDIRIESLMQRPRYNLVRWDKNIKTEEDAVNFFKREKIEYIVSFGPFKINGKNLKDIKDISVVEIFRTINARISTDVYLYRMKQDNLY
jgi:hypothetical protein